MSPWRTIVKSAIFFTAIIAIALVARAAPNYYYFDQIAYGYHKSENPAAFFPNRTSVYEPADRFREIKDYSKGELEAYPSDRLISITPLCTEAFEKPIYAMSYEGLWIQSEIDFALQNLAISYGLSSWEGIFHMNDMNSITCSVSDYINDVDGYCEFGDGINYGTVLLDPYYLTGSVEANPYHLEKKQRFECLKVFLNTWTPLADLGVYVLPEASKAVSARMCQRVVVTGGAANAKNSGMNNEINSAYDYRKAGVMFGMPKTFIYPPASNPIPGAGMIIPGASSLGASGGGICPVGEAFGAPGLGSHLNVPDYLYWWPTTVDEMLKGNMFVGIDNFEEAKGNTLPFCHNYYNVSQSNYYNFYHNQRWTDPTGLNRVGAYYQPDPQYLYFYDRYCPRYPVRLCGYLDDGPDIVPNTEVPGSCPETAEGKSRTYCTLESSSSPGIYNFTYSIEGARERVFPYTLYKTDDTYDSKNLPLEFPPDLESPDMGTIMRIRDACHPFSPAHSRFKESFDGVKLAQKITEFSNSPKRVPEKKLKIVTEFGEQDASFAGRCSNFGRLKEFRNIEEKGNVKNVYDAVVEYSEIDIMNTRSAIFDCYFWDDYENCLQAHPNWVMAENCGQEIDKNGDGELQPGSNGEGECDKCLELCCSSWMTGEDEAGKDLEGQCVDKRKDAATECFLAVRSYMCPYIAKDVGLTFTNRGNQWVHEEINLLGYMPTSTPPTHNELTFATGAGITPPPPLIDPFYPGQGYIKEKAQYDFPPGGGTSTGGNVLPHMTWYSNYHKDKPVSGISGFSNPVHAPYIPPNLPDPRELLSPVKDKGFINREAYTQKAAGGAWYQAAKDITEPTILATTKPYVWADDRGAYKAIGPYGCNIGGWYEMLLYQARCIRYWGLNCICDFQETMWRGSAEWYVLQRAGAKLKARAHVVATIDGQTRNFYFNEYMLWPLALRGTNTANEHINYAGATTQLNNSTIASAYNLYPAAKQMLQNGGYAAGNSPFLKGLDNVQPGDILIWHGYMNGCNKEGGGANCTMGNNRFVPNRRDHVAYVEGAYHPRDASGNLIPGKKIIWVSEFNSGKNVDSCNGTDRWGMMTTRQIYNQFTNDSTLDAVLGGWYGLIAPDGLPLACDDADRRYCVEFDWDMVEIYRPSKDVFGRKNPQDGTSLPPLNDSSCFVNYPAQPTMLNVRGPSVGGEDTYQKDIPAQEVAKDYTGCLTAENFENFNQLYVAAPAEGRLCDLPQPKATLPTSNRCHPDQWDARLYRCLVQNRIVNSCDPPLGLRGDDTKVPSLTIHNMAGNGESLTGLLEIIKNHEGWPRDKANYPSHLPWQLPKGVEK